MNIIWSLMTGAGLAVALHCHAEGTRPLTWADLVNHPERWPANTKLTAQLNFDRNVLKAGTALRIDQVTARGVRLIAPQGFTFVAEPKDCDLVQAANAWWSKLTPEQQALTPQAIARDPSLWPGKVKVLEMATFGSLRINAGSELPVVKVKNDEVGVFHPRSTGMLMFALKDTDLFARARELAALPADQRPGHMSDLLEGAAIDADGRPAALAPARYYVFYFASSSCPRCQVFTPKLVEHFNKALADRKDVAFVTWPTEATTPPMLNYVKEHAIPWPTVLAEKKITIGDFGVMEIPGILVLDRFGTTRLATNKLPGQPLDAAATALARLDTVLQAEPTVAQ